MDPAIGIVVLNWNNWRDTIACVSSVRQLDYRNYRLFVIDNASADGSEQQLRTWDPTLEVIQSGANLGWAGGTNIGIRAALAAGCEHVYLLNNDAMVRPDTLTHLAREAGRPDAAALGSMVIAQQDPSWVEFGGCFVDPRTHHPRQVHCRLDDVAPAAGTVPTVAVKGCSMLLTSAGLSRVGLLSEEYFLNYDESDWCYRARAAGMAVYFVPASVVTHKGAVSFGGTGSPLYRYFVTRNRLLFARRHLDRQGRHFAWRAAFWELKQALLARQPTDPPSCRQRLLLFRAALLGLRDYCLGRTGDCPLAVRRMAERYRAA